MPDNHRPENELPRTPSDPQALIDQARKALNPEGRDAVGDFRRLPTSKVRGAVFNWSDQQWVACRMAQDPSAARLLDAVVAFRSTVPDAVGAVAILTAPTSSAERKGARKTSDDYVRRYQSAAWHGLGVVFVAELPKSEAARSWSVGATPERGDFDDLARAVESQLRADSASWTRAEDSREAEGLVRPSVHRALLAAGFRRSFKDTDKPHGGKCYRGFWRRAEADGVWVRDSGVPRRVALEVKLGEDVEAPLCQVVDHLGHADAVLYVRLRQGGGATNYGAATGAVEALQRRLPVAWIELAAPVA